MGMETVSIHVLLGEDDYRVAEKARGIIDQCVPPDQREFGLEIVDGRVSLAEEAARAIRQCVESLRTLGFFGNRKLVWLRDADFFRDSPLGKTETVKAAVQDLTDTVKAGLPQDQTLMITALKMDKRLAFTKACQAAGARFYDYSPPDKPYEAAKQVAERLRGILAKTGLRMTGAVEEAFLEKVGTETRQMVNEAEKLAVYLGERRTVELKDLADVVCASREAPAWDLLDAVGARDLDGSLRLLRQLLFQSGKESPIGLIHFLAGRFQELIVYRQALDRGWVRSDGGGKFKWGRVPENARRVLTEDLKKNPMAVHPFRAHILAQQATHYAMAELTEAYRAAVNTFEQMVTGRAPAALTLELLLIRILTPAPAKPTA